MYNESDYESIQAQIKRRLLMLLIPCVILVALIAISYAKHFSRDESFQIVAYASALLLVFSIIFVHGMFIAPLIAYKRHLDSLLHGRTHEMKCLFKSLDTTSCLREGVRFYPLIVSAGDLEDEEDDRLFYYDVLVPFPELNEGDAIIITAHDKSVGRIEKA